MNWLRTGCDGQDRPPISQSGTAANQRWLFKCFSFFSRSGTVWRPYEASRLQWTSDGTRGAPGGREVPDTVKCTVFRPPPGLLWGPARACCGPRGAAAGPCRATVGPRGGFPGATGGPGTVQYEAFRCQVGSLQGPKAPPRGARRPRHCKIQVLGVWGRASGLGIP